MLAMIMLGLPFTLKCFSLSLLLLLSDTNNLLAVPDKWVRGCLKNFHFFHQCVFHDVCCSTMSKGNYQKQINGG